MTLIDWAIVAVAVLGLSAFSIATIRYARSVADFLAASRTGGRYMLAVAQAMVGVAAISFVATFEVYYNSGFSSVWWQLMTIAVLPIMTLTGWVYYRFRETRCLTLSQYLEVRYSRRLRIFSGMAAYLSGILNFGIFPAVAARFFVHFCGFPETTYVLGVGLPTFGLVMIATLGATLLFTMGGQVTVMLTDCAQGIFCGVAFIVVALVVLDTFGWNTIVEGLLDAPDNASRFHPFKSMGVKDFPVWFWLIGIFGGFYGQLAFQGVQGYNCSAMNPHEQKMGQIISTWRLIPQIFVLLLLGVCGYMFFHHPQFAAQAAQAGEYLNGLSSQYVADQMRVPVALGYLLPAGIKGLLFAVVLFALVTTQDTYIHSWGSIFIQDVYMPLRKSKDPIDPNFHVRLLRWSILGVGVFAYFFSLLYPPGESIMMFFAITGAVYIGGAGAVVIGGLYWSRGTTAGAFTSLVTGAVLGLTGLILPKFVDNWPINQQYMFLIISLTCIALYIVVSLITRRGKEPFNMAQMLHRGRYAVASDQVKTQETLRARWQTLVGITNEFTLMDKVLAVTLVVWNVLWIGLFAGLTLYNLAFDVPTSWWIRFWHAYIWLQIAVSVPTTIWLTIGGTLDIRRVINRLKTTERDSTDDGSVVHESDDYISSDRDADAAHAVVTTSPPETDESERTR